jgi:NADH:ubiquinone oxidoreductase subunit 4 (subunit M)
MNWLTSLRDQLPLLLVLSPMIGFIVAWAASRFEPKLVRHLAVSNMLCTLVILCGLEWQFESDLATDADAIRLAQQQMSQSVNKSDSLVDIRRTLDRMRTERIRFQWFAVDGINLFSVLLVVVLTILIVWRTDSSLDQDRWFIPLLLLFETASLGALTAYDVRVFLFMSAASAVMMSVFIGHGGNSARRHHSERFLLAPFCGGALIMLGFSMLVIAVPWMKISDSATIPDGSE